MAQKLKKPMSERKKLDLTAERNEPKAPLKCKEKCGIALGDFYMM
jgi:hypothetical protein